MRSVIIPLTFFCLFAPAVLAEDAIKPSPDIEPKEVVRIQLDGLQRDDAVGMAIVWAFAHPNNKQATGPFPRFVQMLHRAPYDILFGHQTSQIKELSRNEEQAAYEVTITGKDGEVFICRWVVGRVQSGEEKGSWMTTAVSAPEAIGKAI